MNKYEEYGEDHSFLGCDVLQFGRKVAIFWRNQLPPSLGQKMEAAGSSAKLLPVCWTIIWQYKPEDHNLLSYQQETLKSHNMS
jgi:hypothetical protein